MLQVFKIICNIINFPSGFLINAENEEIEQNINPRDNQTHHLIVQMVTPSDQIGVFIIEYRYF